MKLIGDFTDTERVRGVMGLTSRDISDDELVNLQVVIELNIELYSWFPDYEARYDAWYNSGNPTAADNNSINLLLSYSTFFAAYSVCSGLELMVAKTITDSKMQMSRYADIDLPGIRKRMLTSAAKAQNALMVVEGIVISITAPTLFSAVVPTSDPVTGN